MYVIALWCLSSIGDGGTKLAGYAIPDATCPGSALVALMFALFECCNKCLPLALPVCVRGFGPTPQSGSVLMFCNYCVHFASQLPRFDNCLLSALLDFAATGDSFVDDRFNNHNWPEELKSHMTAAYNSKDGTAAYAEISSMLEGLGDPYTRIIPPKDYADFRVSSDGELQGVGLLIANQPVNNHLLVLSAIKGGPADR